MTPSVALPLLLLLGGQSAVPPAYRDAPSPETIGRCTLVAGNRTYTLYPCKYRYHYSKATGHSLSFEQKRPRNYYTRFGYIDFTDSTRTLGEVSWNGPTISNLHADNFFPAKFRRMRNCWVSGGDRFCFSPMPATR